LRLKNYSIFSRNILIWGAGKAGKVLAVKLLFENNYGIKIIGFIDDFKVVGSEIISGLKILGDKKSLYDLKNKYAIDEIIVAIDNIDYNNLLDILDVCNKSELNVKLSSELFNIIPQKMFTEVYAGTPVIDISPRVNNDFNHIVKRIIDIVCSSIGLLVLLPLFLILAILIKISSKGPILYKNIRIGKNGKPFIFYKFRSMTVSNNGDMERQKIMIEFMKNSYTQNGEDTKIINSDRLTGIGKFIRKISLDELPQLINVLKGEMSLVGPRPCLPYEYDNYDEWQKRRVSVTPGCTGVWQVSGRSKVSFNDSVVLDLYYIHNMNPWLDLQLIIKTIPVMLFGMGGK
jgi:undecaprenyl-phosphate galactose phosphotransferase